MVEETKHGVRCAEVLFNCVAVLPRDGLGTDNQPSGSQSFETRGNVTVSSQLIWKGGSCHQHFSYIVILPLHPGLAWVGRWGSSCQKQRLHLPDSLSRRPSSTSVLCSFTALQNLGPWKFLSFENLRQVQHLKGISGVTQRVCLRFSVRKNSSETFTWAERLLGGDSAMVSARAAPECAAHASRHECDLK